MLHQGSQFWNLDLAAKLARKIRSGETDQELPVALHLEFREGQESRDVPGTRRSPDRKAHVTHVTPISQGRIPEEGATLLVLWELPLFYCFPQKPLLSSSFQAFLINSILLHYLMVVSLSVWREVCQESLSPVVKTGLAEFVFSFSYRLFVYLW